jgi:hypothetical protein
MPRWLEVILIAVGAIVLLPFVWWLVVFAFGLAFSLLKLAVIVGLVALVAIFIVGLIRRLLVAR